MLTVNTVKKITGTVYWNLLCIKIINEVLKQTLLKVEF